MTTLRDAAEALLKAARHPLVDPAKPRDETRGEAPAALFDTLRAALSADAAWRARAEAAIQAMAAALDCWRHEGCPACGGDCASANPPVVGCPLRALQEADAARRRYEETCRGSN